MANSTKTKAVRPFGMRDKIGYAFGDFGNDFTFILSSSFLLKFYTDVMGVSAGLVGTMMMIARFVDAVTDVTMGQIVDRSAPTAKGKFVPWMRRFSIPVAVASFLMYASYFQNMPMAFKIVWMFATYLLWGSFCYTGVNIPYGSMASAITDDPQQRTQLSSWRNIGATLASTVIGVVLPLVVYYTDADGNSVLSGTRMTIAAGVCSIGAIICYMLCTGMVTERVTIEKKTEKFSIGKLVKQLFSSRALISIIVAAIVLLLSQLTMSSMSQYVFPNYFGSSVGISIATLCGSVLSIVMALFVIPKASARWGKKEIAIFGNIVAAIAYLVLFIIHTHNMAVYIIGYILGYFGIAFFNGVIWAMIVDVIDEDEVRRGTRSDGTIYSLYSFARKIGQALSSGLSGWLLTLVGYTSATAYDTDVVNGIYNIGTIIPCIGFVLLDIVLIFWYPLSKDKVIANNKILQERHAADKKN